MNLKDRIFAAETEFGCLLIKTSAILAVVVATVGEGGEYLQWIPPGFIPVWVKTGVALILLAGAAYGKLTVKSNAKDS